MGCEVNGETIYAATRASRKGIVELEFGRLKDKKTRRIKIPKGVGAVICSQSVMGGSPFYALQDLGENGSQILSISDQGKVKAITKLKKGRYSLAQAPKLAAVPFGYVLLTRNDKTLIVSAANTSGKKFTTIGTLSLDGRPTAVSAGARGDGSLWIGARAGNRVIIYPVTAKDSQELIQMELPFAGEKLMGESGLAK